MTCFPTATTASHSSLCACECHWAARAQCLSKSALPWTQWFTGQCNILHLKKKNCYHIPCLDGGRKHIFRKSCMKTKVKVRGTINKEPLLPGLFWERKGKTKEMLTTQGSRELFQSMFTHSTDSRLWNIMWKPLNLPSGCHSWVQRGVKERAGILQPLQPLAVSSASTFLLSV